MSVRLLVINLIVVAFVGCSQSKLVPFTVNPSCQTTVEGQYFAGDTWEGQSPALILKETQNDQIIYGKILHISSDSVLFDGAPQGPFYNPDPTTYSLNEVTAVIDTAGQVVHGYLPTAYSTSWRMELHIIRKGDPDQKVRRMMLHPESPFSFCLEPGTYQVEQIFFHDPKGNMDRLAETPDFEFTIQAQAVNYLGDFYLDVPGDQGTKYELDYVIDYRPNSVPAAGMVGGAIGGVLLAAYQSAQGVIGTHTLRVVNNVEYTPQAPHPKQTHLLHIQSNRWGK